MVTPVIGAAGCHLAAWSSLTNPLPQGPSHQTIPVHIAITLFALQQCIKKGWHVCLVPTIVPCRYQGLERAGKTHGTARQSGKQCASTLRCILWTCALTSSTGGQLIHARVSPECPLNTTVYDVIPLQHCACCYIGKGQYRQRNENAT